MRHRRRLCALAVIALTALTLPAFAQRPGTRGDLTLPPGKSKSNEHRIVGKVLHIDQKEGVVKLATEEGVLAVGVSASVLQTFRVGDTVSVPRSAAESPSASPREKK